MGRVEGWLRRSRKCEDVMMQRLLAEPMIDVIKVV